MLVKDGGLANKYVSVSGTGAIGDPYVVEHSLSVLPDTALGDLASMSADLGTIQADIAAVKVDIAHMKADLASVDCKTYKGADHTTTTGAAEEITIPAGALIVQLFCGVGCEAHIQLNADATTDSPSVEAPFPIPAIALGDVTKLSIWCVSGKMTAWFFGA